jgi:hypothetical protein
VKKIPTLFLRDPDDMRRVTREVHPDCGWVLAGEGVATRKYDGTCVRVDAAGRWYARREVKPGKATPPNFEPVETDQVTGKTVGWEPIEQSAFVKYHAEALANAGAPGVPWPTGTYELIGPKVNGNPEGCGKHLVIRHSEEKPAACSSAQVLDGVPRDFDGLAKFLADLPYEGIVWHHEDGRMAKLKRRDFPKGTA